MPKEIIGGLGDLEFRRVIDEIAEERKPKTMTLLVEVEATRPVIDEFAAVARSAGGELSEMGFAFHELCNCARRGKVSLAGKVTAYSPFDFQ